MHFVLLRDGLMNEQACNILSSLIVQMLASPVFVKTKWKAGLQVQDPSYMHV